MHTGLPTQNLRHLEILMSSQELARIDREYQKEIRRQKMTDAAKIGLLVSMNAQQYQANVLSEQVHEQAVHTNQMLGHMAGILEQIASLQETQLEMVQRERSLKEIIFQFEKFLEETEGYNDPVSAAFGVKRLFELLDDPEMGFSTADLSDMNDKRHFDSLLQRAKRILTDLPQNQFSEIEEFERLLGIYQQRQMEEFDPIAAIPVREHIKLSEKFDQEPSFKDEDLPKSELVKQAEEAEAGAFFKAGCGGCLLTFGALGLITVIPFLVRGEMMVMESGERESPAFGTTISLVLAIAGLGLLYSFITNRGQQKELSKRANHEKVITEKRMKKQQALKLQKWRQAQKSEQEKVARRNQEIDIENAAVEKKRKQAQLIYDATTQDMRRLLNRFLDQHPPIRRFVARV